MSLDDSDFRMFDRHLSRIAAAISLPVLRAEREAEEASARNYWAKAEEARWDPGDFATIRSYRYAAARRDRRAAEIGEQIDDCRRALGTIPRTAQQVADERQEAAEVAALVSDEDETSYALADVAREIFACKRDRDANGGSENNERLKQALRRLGELLGAESPGEIAARVAED